MESNTPEEEGSMERITKDDSKRPNWCSVAHTKKKVEDEAMGKREAILYYAEAIAHRRRLQEDE
jgi:hypothetical protein